MAAIVIRSLAPARCKYLVPVRAVDSIQLPFCYLRVNLFFGGVGGSACYQFYARFAVAFTASPYTGESASLFSSRRFVSQYPTLARMTIAVIKLMSTLT